MDNIKKYFSFIKFSHTIFAMPFALIGFFTATTIYSFPFEIKRFIAVIAAMIFARNAAMSFNRYIDRNFDKLNPRTAKREIPAGLISLSTAGKFIFINSILFIATTLFINKLALYLSPVALVVILGYSYTKRFTALCHIVLGIGLALAPIGAFIAVTGKFALLPIFYSIIVLFWTSGFDIIFALQDYEFDKKNSLYSIPAGFGKKKALIISALFHLVSAGTLIFIAFYYKFGILFYIGSTIFIILLIVQHLLVKPNNLTKVNIAFATTNGLASVIFASFVIASYYFN